MSEEHLRKNPIPWLTRNSIEFIEKNIKSTDNVLEFGGGWSSIWWAKRVNYTLTVEANPKWASKLISEMSEHPDALLKWSLKFVPSDWNPDHTRLKKYWKSNKKYLNHTAIKQLNNRYLEIDFDPDIIVIDGSIRPLNIKKVNEYLISTKSKVRMIIIDNTEVLKKHTENKFNTFKQYDFNETNISLIPKWQNGKWCTTVWLKK